MTFPLSCMTLSCLRPRKAHDPEICLSVNVVRLLVVHLYPQHSQTKCSTDLYCALQEDQTGAKFFRSNEGSAHGSGPVKVRIVASEKYITGQCNLHTGLYLSCILQATTRSGKFVAWIKKPLKGLPGQKDATKSPVSDAGSSAPPSIHIQV